MTFPRFLFLFGLLISNSISTLRACDPPAFKETAPAYPDPSRFEEDIQAFEAKSKATPPPEGAIVAIGSSSLRMWTKIDKDLAPLRIIHRGFGGSMMNDALYFADRIVLPYRPRAVLLYEGDNDAAMGISPEKIVETFNEFVLKIHRALPATRVYVLALKPSILRWNIWDTMQKANELLKAACNADPLLTFIDVASPMLDRKNAPKSGIFLQDKLHMNRRGYVIWKKAIRPVLMGKESKFEK